MPETLRRDFIINSSSLSSIDVQTGLPIFHKAEKDLSNKSNPAEYDGEALDKLSEKEKNQRDTGKRQGESAVQVLDDLQLQAGRVTQEENEIRQAIKPKLKRIKYSAKEYSRREQIKKSKLRYKLINSVKRSFESNNNFLVNTTKQIIDWIIENPVEFTNIMMDSGANISLMNDPTVLKNIVDCFNTKVSGINDKKSTLEACGSYGMIDVVYTSKELEKSLIPPQVYVSKMEGSVALLHILVQKSPAISVIVGLDVKTSKILGIYGISSPVTNNIMVWCPQALLDAKANADQFEVIGNVSLKNDTSESNEFNFESYSTSIETMNPEMKVDLAKWCLNGMSSRAMKKLRMTGIDETIDEMKLENEKVDIAARTSRFTRKNKLKKNMRAVPVIDCKPLEFLICDLIWFSELESSGTNRTFKTRDGGYTGMLLVYDVVGRGAWLEPIKTEAADFKKALTNILIDITNLGENRSTKEMIWRPMYLKCDKAKSQSKKALEGILTKFKMTVVSSESGHDMKSLDRYVRTLRTQVNYMLLKCENLLEYSHILFMEANRRLKYISSSNGSWVSAYERYTGLVPSIDVMFPPVGATAICKVSKDSKIGATQAIVLGINELEGTYILYYPRIDTVMETSEAVFITKPRPADGLERMQRGIRLYDDEMLNKGFLIETKTKLRGPIWIKDMTHPYKFSYHQRQRNHLNLPTRKNSVLCNCGYQCDTLKALHDHYTKVKRDGNKYQGLEHPDIFAIPKSLVSQNKKIQRTYRKVVMDQLMNSKSKDMISSQPKLFEKRKRNETTSEYQLRNGKKKGKSLDAISKDKRIRIASEKRAKVIKKTNANEILSKTTKAKRGKCVTCKEPNCLEKLYFTPAGRVSAQMKRHAQKHVEDKIKMQTEIEEEKHDNQQRRKRKTRRPSRFSNEANTANGDYNVEDWLEINLNPYDVKTLSDDTKVRKVLNAYDDFKKEPQLLYEMNETVEVDDDYAAQVDTFFASHNHSNHPTVSKRVINMCRTMYYDQPELMEVAPLPTEEDIDQMVLINSINLLCYGTELTEELRNFPVDDILPSCQPCTVPHSIDFKAMLAMGSIDECYDFEKLKVKTEFLSRVDGSDWNGLKDINRPWSIPLVNTARVVIDPAVATGMMGRLQLKKNYKFRSSSLEEANYNLDTNNGTEDSTKVKARRMAIMIKKREVMDEITTNMTFAQRKSWVPVNTNQMYLSPLMLGYVDAVQREVDNLNGMGCWTAEPLPEGTIPIGTRFCYDIKWDLKNNRFLKFKARLVAKGYSQIAFDSFNPDTISSPVMQSSSLNVILGMTATLGFELNQIDIVNAFITAKLEDKIWVKLPAFCQISEDGNITMGDVTKLDRPLYGLKQGSSCFFSNLRTFLVNFGFVQSSQDPCVFTYIKDGISCIIGTHVDDLLVASTKGFFTDILVPAAEKYFPHGVKHGPASQFLGCIITNDLEKKEVRLSQKGRIIKLKEMFNITRQSEMPLPPKYKQEELFGIGSLSIEESDKENCLNEVNLDPELPTFANYNEVKTYYRSYTGNLVYLATCGRPDIQAIVYRMARYQENPGIVHIKAVRHIIQYLVFTQERELVFGRQKMADILVTHSDSSFADCPATGRSTGGYVHYLFGNYLSSRSFKINCVTRSVTEAEFYTMSAAAADAIYFRDLYNETIMPIMRNELGNEKYSEIKTVNLGHNGLKAGHEILLSGSINPYTWMEPTDGVVLGDNSSAILQAKKGANKRSKHIKIHNSYIWEQIHIFGNIKVGKISTKQNSADLQTKVLGAEPFKQHSRTIMGEGREFIVNFMVYYSQLDSK